jgi:hypothetical protein
MAGLVMNTKVDARVKRDVGEVVVDQYGPRPESSESDDDRSSDGV